jgi:hypothetical protein
MLSILPEGFCVSLTAMIRYSDMRQEHIVGKGTRGCKGDPSHVCIMVHDQVMAEVGAVLAFRILTTNRQVHRLVLVHVRTSVRCYWLFHHWGY